jgi:hypothetical protein
VTTGDPEAGEERRYALELDEREVERYRLMAEQARADEVDLWELAGIGPACGWPAAWSGPAWRCWSSAAATSSGSRRRPSVVGGLGSARAYNRGNSPA